MENSIEIKNLRKSYGKTEALKGISFQVEKSALFGLIGPDGAGKTSLIRILTTLLISDEGRATIEGLDVVENYSEIRKIVGYMPGRFSLYQDLSVLENLKFFATIFGTTIQENYDLIREIYVQIEPFKHRRAGKLSGGMKQKLALCCALVHQPKVLILDEPTTGVDAVSRQEFWEMLRRLKEKDITILVSTPYMDEAKLCDRVALIQDGKILSVNSPDAIVGQFERPLLEVRSGKMFQLLKDLRDFPATHSAFPFGEFVHLTTNEAPDIPGIQNYLGSKGHREVKIQAVAANIEDCFMELMRSSRQ